MMLPQDPQVQGFNFGEQCAWDYVKPNIHGHRRFNFIQLKPFSTNQHLQKNKNGNNVSELIENTNRLIIYTYQKFFTCLSIYQTKQLT